MAFAHEKKRNAHEQIAFPHEQKRNAHEQIAFPDEQKRNAHEQIAFPDEQKRNAHEEKQFPDYRRRLSTTSARGRAKPCTRWFHLAVFTISYAFCQGSSPDPLRSSV